MKAINIQQFGTSEQLKLAERSIPNMQAHTVKVRVYAAGVNPSDVYTSTGTYAVVPELPYTPGLDGAGIVEEVGEAVTHVNVGDRVFIAASTQGLCSGTFAQYIVCDAAFVHPLPAHITFEQGAALGIPALTAYRALFDRAELQQGQSVLIHGASGAVGLQAVQMAKAAGAFVIGTASRTQGKELVKAAGADVVLDHISAENVEALRDATNGKGPDIIIEFLANVNLQTDVEVVAKRGVIVVIGNRGDITVNPRVMMQKECDVRGMILWNATADEYAALIKGVTTLLEEKVLQPVIGQAFPLEQAGAAFDAVMAGTYNGKVIVTID